MTTVNTKAVIVNMITANSSGSEPTSTPASVVIADSEDSLWAEHDSYIASAHACEGCQGKNIDDRLNDILRLPLSEREENPMDRWKIATSVPSERLFSKARQVVTDDRSRLKGKHVNELLFLGSLSHDDWGLV